MAKSKSSLSVIRAINSNNRLSAVSRRRFIHQAAVGTAGAALMLGNAGNLLAGSKDVGQITLDGLLITYFGSPLGTDGSVNYTFRPSYSMTLGFRSLNNPDITLSAGAPPEGKSISQGVRVAASRQVEDALTIYPHSHPNERYGVTVRQPALP